MALTNSPVPQSISDGSSAPSHPTQTPPEDIVPPCSPWRLCVAPMLDWSDRHARYFQRLISRQVRLYTEMVTTGALLHGDRARHLDFHPAEHPLALQLGGSDPAQMAACAKMGEDWGYDEININVGCPSDRVQNGRFGACLMAEPALVAACVAAMKAVVRIPVTVKTRLGIDDRDSYEELCAFTAAVTAAGTDALIVHARKAWLKGLSPKENRDIPPLRHDWVLRLKADFPALPMIINGGIRDLDQARSFLDPLEGVMIGRGIYQNPWLLARADRDLFGDPRPLPDRHQILEDLIPYLEERMAAGVPLQAMTRHILDLFQGQPGAKRWRRTLSENVHRPGADVELLWRAMPPRSTEGPYSAGTSAPLLAEGQHPDDPFAS